MKPLNRLLSKVLSPLKKVQFHLEQKRLAAYIIATNNQKRAFLFGSPRHSDMGDQAQTYCIQRWINKNYRQHHVIIFHQSNVTDQMITVLRKNIRPDDMIFFHSGYHLTDLYPVRKAYCKVASEFSDHKIVVFPQTVNFVTDKDIEKEVADTFNNHCNITLLCRDELSYSTAQSLFHRCKLHLYPDIVTSLIGTRYDDNASKNGILFCMRKDKEAFYSVDEKNNFYKRFDIFNTTLIDTTISTSYKKIKKNREVILKNMLDTFAQHKLVITDRYHGTIFSLITNTPVIVIASTDHKLSSGVKWFPESFRKYVSFAKDLDSAYNKAIEILSRTEIIPPLPDYFEQRYYSKLKVLLENEIM
ncbi:MAG: polysaccharide pyruvyl transferase family protein [Paludibacteraceae bacterium]